MNKKYSCPVKSIEETELLNYLYPTQAVEILLTKNDYLISPTFNKEYFLKTNKEIPKSKFNDEHPESHQFIDKGLFIDENDFYNSMIRSEGSLNFISIYSGLDINNNNLFDKEKIDSLPNYLLKTEENDKGRYLKLTKDTMTPNTFQLIDSILISKPFEFTNISFDKLDDFQEQNYSSIITECIEYIDPYKYNVSEDLTNDMFSILSLSKSFLKKIIEKK